MARRPSPLVPRKITIGSAVRWEVRVPAELHKQEKSSRPRFIKEAEAKGYCNRLKADLVRYSDKSRGLTDAQKIEAHACFERLAGYPATLTQAVDLLIARLDRAARSFAVSELAERVTPISKNKEAVAAANGCCARFVNGWHDSLAFSVAVWSATLKQ